MTTVQSPVRAARPGGGAAERVLLLAADSTEELAELLDSAAAGHEPPQGNETGARIGVVEPTPKRLAMARKVVAKGNPWRGRRDIWFSPDPLLASGGGGVAFVFPGLEADFEPRVQDIAELLGRPAPELSSSTVGRHAAAVFAVGGLLDEALRALGIRPDAVAGHSAGEWQAMIAGGIVSRAEFDEMMSGAELDALQVPGVEFAVLGCSAERAGAELARRPDLVISHENSPNQTVVCGPEDQVNALIERLRSSGVICQSLPFQSGFHTPMLEPYLGPFAERGLPGLPMRRATIPVWSATTARPFPDEEAAIRALSIRHLLEPVRFRQQMLAMYTDGIRVFIQAGPGQLGSLIHDTLQDVDHLTVAANSAHRSGKAQLRRVATALWVEGGHPDFALLDRNAPARARNSPRPPPGPERVPAPSEQDRTPTGAIARLREVAACDVPFAAELTALLDDMAGSVAEVIEAARQPRPAQQALARRPEPAPARLAEPQAADSVLEVSTTAMPYLLDHCLSVQREDWPDESDRRPVVPATTMVAHMVDAALDAAPGRVATEVRDIRFRKWLVAAPAERVPIQVRPIDGAQVAVRLGEYAEAVVVLAQRHRPAAQAPQQQPREEVPALTAQEIYTDRWMFHGPRFQGISRYSGISPRSISGRLTVTDPPGSLLDNWGQLLGLWMTQRHRDRPIAFPASIERIVFHTPEPTAGSTVDATVRIGSLDQEWVVADGAVSDQGRSLITVTGWKDYRVEGDWTSCTLHRFPGRSTLSTRAPGGWWYLADPWSSLVAREFYLTKYLGAAERDEYQQCPPPQRWRWLAARIVIKDAVRGRLWDTGYGQVFPAELQVWQDPAGGYRVTGRHRLSLPPLDIDVAQSCEMAVAMVAEAEGGLGAGIEISEVLKSALGVHKDIRRDEELLLDGLRNATGDALPVALARLALARRTVLNAGGCDPVLRGIDGTTLVMSTGDQRVTPPELRVRTECLDNPDRLPLRQYVVAWVPATAGGHPTSPTYQPSTDTQEEQP